MSTDIETVIEVDESGIVAAGATTLTIGTTAVQAPQFAMTMDHPFFYAIQDDETGGLLFIGVLMNPSRDSVSVEASTGGRHCARG